MIKKRFQDWVNHLVRANWRGRPLYILLVYLAGQLLIDPPVFLASVWFVSYVTGVELSQFVATAGVATGGLVLLASVFYLCFSRSIRRFLAATIAGEGADAALATAAWREAVTYPQRIIGYVIVTTLFIYGSLVPLSAIRYGLYSALSGSIVGAIATISMTQVVYLFYLEWVMVPVARLAIDSGGQPSLDALRRRRLRLGTKLLVLILLIVIVPVTMVGLGSYSQVVTLGGNPTRSMLLIGTMILVSSLIAILLALFVVRSVLLPVQEIRRVVDEIGQGNLNVTVHPLTTDELAELGLRMNQMVDGLRQTDRLKSAFGRYVSPAVRDGIIGGDIVLGGERREITILFTDIRNFTTWCESESPESVIQTLNMYYENLVQTLYKYGGTVTRYTGDGVLALFGAPLELPNHALNAVLAVWEAYTLLEKFNDLRRTLGAFELHTGFGIHTGLAVVGSIGCEARAEYTPIGDAANVASRIEGLNKDLSTSILISDDTYQRVSHCIIVGKQAEVMVKGRTHPVKVVEVAGLCPGPL